METNAESRFGDSSVTGRCHTDTYGGGRVVDWLVAALVATGRRSSSSKRRPGSRTVTTGDR